MPPLTFLYISSVIALKLVSCYPHIPFFEQELYQGSSYPDDDWSFDNPFVIPLDAEKGWSPSLSNSRAFGSLLFLRPEDLYDVALIEIPEDAAKEDSIVVGLQALPPDCPDYESFYPAIALLGPATDPSFSEVNETMRGKLPFDIPEGYGAIIREPPRIERDVFTENPVQGYLLPPYITKECLMSAEGFSSCADGKAAEFSVITDVQLTPGRYYIVWWDPDRTSPDVSSSPREVMVSLGFNEERTQNETAVMMNVILGETTPEFYACLGTFVNTDAPSSE